MENLTLIQLSAEDLKALVMDAVREVIDSGTSINATATSPEKLVTTQQLCEHLGVTEPTVLRWRKKGKIPFFEIGSAIRFNLSEVRKSLEKC